MKISKHISLTEATKSNSAIRLGIPNIPSSTELEAMSFVAENIFEPIREHFGIPIGISSFYRSKELNSKIPGSSTTSQHCKGEAIDIDADIYGGVTNKEIYDFVKNNLEFDQLIDEFNLAWVHVSLKKSGNRKQILKKN